MSTQLIFYAITAILGVWGIVLYNRLIRDRNRLRAAWSDIDVQLKRRHDLIPKLVEMVKGYSEYERETLEAVTQLRAESERASRVADIGALETSLGERLHRLVALAEAYPELKADDSFQRLHQSLVEVEDHIQYARRYYNGAVRIFNTRIESFPDLIVARPFRFTEEEFFEIEDPAQRTAPVLDGGAA